MSNEDCRIKYHRWKDYIDRDDFNLNQHIGEVIAEVNRLEEDLLTPEENHLFTSEYLPQYIRLILEKRFFHSPRADYCFILDFFYSLLSMLLKSLPKSTSGYIDSILLMLDYEKTLYSKNYCVIIQAVEKDLIESSHKLYQKKNELFYNSPSKSLNVLFNLILNFFGHLNGFTVLSEYSSHCKVIEQLVNIIKTITYLEDVMFTLPWRKSAKPIFFNCLKSFSQFTEEDLKSIQKFEIKQIFTCIEKFILRLKTKPKYFQLIETCQLETFYKLLVFGNLEKKIFGISELVSIITHAKNLDEDNEKRSKGLPVYFSDYREVSKWLTTEKYLEWLDSKDFCSFLFSSVVHNEVLKRSSDILKFLYINSRVSQELILKLWQTTFEKHEAEREALIGLIQDLIGVMDCDDLKFLYERLEALPLALVDFQILQIIKSFAKLGYYYWPNSKNKPKDKKPEEDKAEESESYSMEPEKNIEPIDLARIIPIVEGQAIPLPPPDYSVSLPSVDYQGSREKRSFDSTLVLDILWKMWLGRDGISFDISKQAAAILKESLLYNYRDRREKFIVKCIENIKLNEFVMKSCEMIKGLLDSFPSGNPQGPGLISKSTLMKNLDLEHNFIEVLNTNLVLFKKSALEQAYKEIGDNEPEGSDYEAVFSIIKVGKDLNLPYLEELKQRLAFLSYIFTTNQDFLTQANLTLLHETFVLNAVSEQESGQFFYWLSLFMTSWSYSNILSNEFKLFIFKDLILKIEPSSFTTSAFECFEKFFIGLNKEHGLVKSYYYEESLEVLDIKLIAIENLWDIMLESSNDSVFSYASRLLMRIYRGMQVCEVSTQEEFIHTCMSSISSSLSQEQNDFSVNKISRCLSLLLQFIEAFENTSRETGKDVVISIKNNCSSERNHEFSVILKSTALWSHAREVITKEVNLKTSLLFLHRGQMIDSKEDKKTLEDLGIDGSAKIIISEDTGTEMEMMNIDKPVEDISSNISHLKGIFDDLDDDILKLALEKFNNQVEETVMYLLDESNKERLRSQLTQQKTPEVPKQVYKISEILSNSEAYFSLFFNLLSLKSYKIEETTWSLLHKLPVNKQLLHSIQNIDGSEDWNDLFDKTSIHKLLYSLQIVDKILSGEAESWKQFFFELGGAHHLYTILVEYKSFGLYGLTEAKILDCLFRILGQFLISQESIPEVWGIVDEKLLIDCALEIIEESSKFLYRMEIYLARTLDFLVILLRHQPELLEKVYSRSVFDFLISNVLLSSGETAIREAIVNAVGLIINSFDTLTPNKDGTQGHEDPVKHFWRIVNEKIPKDNNMNCDEFFSLTGLLLYRNLEVSEDFIDYCLKFITEREVIEDRKLMNQDKVVSGHFYLLQVIIPRFPGRVNSSLLSQLLGDLFDLEVSRLVGFNSTPKYKHPTTRKIIFSLVLTITSISPGLSNELLNFLYSSKTPASVPSSTPGPPPSFAKSDSDLRLKSTTGFVGLRNFGSTCYLNSLIQQLFMIQDLRSSLLHAPLKHGCQADSLLYQVKVLICSLIHSEKECYEPTGFCLAFKGYDGESINPRIQQDVDEFLSLLLDKLETELKDTGCDDLIRKHVGGVLVHEIESCEENFPYNSEREEHFFRISLDVKNKKNIAEALDLFVKPDVLDGDNKYFCDKYEAKISAKKRCRIRGLEKTVIVHLKRFEFDLDTMQRVKVNDYCEFPMEINLKPWCKEQDKEDEDYLFELVGVLLHSGGADSGHYTSIIKDRDSMVWYKFDDRYVERYGIENLAADCFGGETQYAWAGNSQSYAQIKNAYMLVYERKGVQAQGLAESSQDSCLSTIIEEVKSQNLKFFKDLLYMDPGYYDFIRHFSKLFQFTANLEYRPEFSLSSDLHQQLRITKLIEQNPLMVSLSIPEILNEPSFQSISISSEDESDQSYKLLKFISIFAFEIYSTTKNTEVLNEWILNSQNLFFNHVQASIWILGYIIEKREILYEVLFESKDFSIKDQFSMFFGKLAGFASYYEKEYENNHLNLIDLEKLPAYSDCDFSNLIKTVFHTTSLRFIQLLMKDLVKEYLKPNRRISNLIQIIKNLIMSNEPTCLFLIRLDAISELLSILVTGDKALSPEETEEILQIISKLVVLTFTYAMKDSNNIPYITYIRLDDTTESFLTDFRTFRLFLSKFSLPSVQSIILHLCWENFKISVEYLEDLANCLFLYKSDITLAQKYLELIKCILFLNDSIKSKRIEELVAGDLVKSFNQSLIKIKFFENLKKCKSNHPNFVMSVLIWWSNIIATLDLAFDFTEKYESEFRWVISESFVPDSQVVDFMGQGLSFEETFEESLKSFRKIVKSDDEMSDEEN